MPGTFSPLSPLRAWLVVFVMVAALVATPLMALAQTDVPAAEEPPLAEESVPEEPVQQESQEQAPPPAEQPPPAEVQVQQEQAPPPIGSLEVRLTGTNGVGLSGLFAATDAAGAYHERWAEGGTAWFPELVAGTATISQLSGTTDFAFDSSDPSYVDVPAGGHAVLPIVNAFLDADGDGVGDSVDICGAGNDAVDTDADGTPDACDETPNGDSDGDGIDELDDSTPNGDDDADGIDNAVDACPAGDDVVDTDADGEADACDETPAGEPTPEPATSAVTAEVAAEPVVVDGVAVTCDQLAGLTPTIASDLAAYEPGALVTLTGAGWAPGQVVTIAVSPDGASEWRHTADVTADDTGAFAHEFTLPEPEAAQFRAVATGQCATAPAKMAEIVAEVAAEPEVVASAPVTCQQANAVAPTIATDLADYPPGALVTLTGGNWVAGQIIEILVEDDGLAEAEYGPWSHATTVTADAQGAFTHQFNIAPYFVADYTVVATGECREARTSFTDANLEFRLAPTGVPATSASWTRHSNSTCTAQISGGSNSGSGTMRTSGTTLTVGANASQWVRITAPTVSGYSFVNWTGPSTITSATLCAPGDATANTHVWTANYSTIAGLVYVQISGATTASISWERHSNTGCTNSVQTGTATANSTGPTVTSTTSISSSQGMKLKANSNAGGSTAFLNWTSDSGLTRTELEPCVTGSTSAQVWTANYITPGRVYVKTSGISAATIGWEQFNNGGCGGSPNSSGSTAANNSGTPALTTVASATNRSIELTAPTVSGATFSSWTSQSGVTSTTAVTCVQGSSNAQIWTANYVASRTTQTGLQLTAGTNPSAFGDSVTFTATVTATEGNPDSVGTVTFMDGTTVLCFEVSLSGNTATCATSSLSVGDHNVTAEYSGTTSGTPRFSGSTSPALPHSVDDAAPTAADLALSCMPASASVNAGQAQTVDCTYSAQSSLGTHQVTLAQVTVPAPSGWTIASTVGTVSGSTLTIAPNVTISSSPAQSYAFSYTLTPDCAASTSDQAMALTSLFTFNGGGVTTGATFTGQVARTDTSSLAIALQSPATLGWTQPVSFTGTTVTGNIVYRITASGCGGWNVQVSASPFVYAGSSNGAAIPAANLQLTSAGAPAVVSGSGSGVSAQPASGPMSSSKLVLAATAGSGIGAYDQQLNFSLEIPANSRTGTYTSTITIASATGP